MVNMFCPSDANVLRKLDAHEIHPHIRLAARKALRWMPADARQSLQEARLDAIDRIAALARSEGAPIVLVAGDVFDSTEPGDRVLRQALSRMKGAPDVSWYLLPGNHDHAGGEGLWNRLASEAPANVFACLKREPIAIGQGAWLLPAPLMHTRSIDDPTAWFETAGSPAGSCRIGLAHGSITSFAATALPRCACPVTRSGRSLREPGGRQLSGCVGVQYYSRALSLASSAG
jgi:hypothetical protein